MCSMTSCSLQILYFSSLLNFRPYLAMLVADNCNKSQPSHSTFSLELSTGPDLPMRVSTRPTYGQILVKRRNHINCFDFSVIVMQ